MYDALLSSFRLKRLQLKNRIVSTAHSPGYAEDGMPGLRYQLYHEEKAKGGIALTMFGGSSIISPDSPPSFGQLDVSTDQVIPYFNEFAKRIHAHGAGLICQLTHVGRRTHWQSGNWLPVVAPSSIREPAHRSFPKTLEPAEITRIIQHFGDAAARCQQGDLDGCEILVSGHLIGQFWTPLVNQRDDRYGGSLDNRLRFGLDVLTEIRRRVGKEFIVGIRFSVDDMTEGGIQFDEALEIAQRHVDSDLVDYLNIVCGNNWANDGLAYTIPNMSFPIAPYLMLASKIRQNTNIPIIHAGRIPDLSSGDFAIREGHVDLIGMTRAHMADPHIVRKLERGEEKLIRTCIGANYCIDRIYRGAAAYCIQNPSTGREAQLPHLVTLSEKRGKRIIVIGGGPAGLEAARVSRARGHDVTLCEAAGKLGGQVRLAAHASWRRDLISIVDWLSGEVERGGCTVKLGTYVELDQVHTEDWDVVIIATGGLPNTDVVEGAQHAVSVWNILSRDVLPGKNILVFDDHGQHQAASAAEFLVETGSAVEFVTPDRSAFIDLGPTNAAIHFRNLYKHNVQFRMNWRLVSIQPEHDLLLAVLRNEYSKTEEVRRVDQIVIEHGTCPNDRLFMDLRNASRNVGETDIGALLKGQPQPWNNDQAGGYQLFRIGDAVTSRDIHAAILDARRLCKDL